MAATRFYFAAGGTAANTPTYNSEWDSTASITTRPLHLASELVGTTDTLASQINETSTSSPFDRLCRYHVSASQVATAHTISGTFSMVVCGVESSANLNGFLQVIIEVWDSTGTTKRGTLYAGTLNTSESASAGAINQEFPITTAETRIISAQAVTSVAASVGDRIVVGYGFRACNTSATSMGVSFRVDDKPADSDYALTAGLTTTGLRPWIEFSDDIFATSQSYTGGAAKTVTVSTSSAARLGLGGAATKTITVTPTAAARLGITAAATKTITAAATSAGQRGKLGAGTSAVTASATSAGRLGASGAATRTISISATSVGTVAASSTGTAARTITISSVSAARLGRSGQSAPVLTLTPSAVGVRATAGTAAVTLTLTATAAGVAQVQPRDIKVLAINDLSRAVDFTDLSRTVGMVEQPRELTITEQVYL